MGGYASYRRARIDERQGTGQVSLSRLPSVSTLSNHGKRLASLLQSASLGVILTLMATPAHARDTKANTVARDLKDAQSAAGQQDTASGDIIVTATRREQSLQNVPIAVTALSGDQLATARVNSTASLGQQVPNLVVTSFASGLAVFLRGVGQLAINPGQEPSVATYVDGVYQPTVFGSLLTLANVQRLEVIKGPQGTLFGRNATGGLINIVTKDPGQDPHADILLSYGNYQSLKASAYVSGGLAPNIAADLSLYYAKQNKGFGTNVTTGERLLGTENTDVRGKIVATPSDRTTITVSGSYTQNKGSTGGNLAIVQGQSAFGFSPLPGFYDIQAGTEPRNRQTNYQVSGKIKQELEPFDVVSITSFTRTTTFETEDVDATPLPILNLFSTQLTKVFTQELQLVSKPDSRLHWIAGAFYFKSNGLGSLPFGTSLRGVAFGSPLGGINSRVQLKTESIAGFGEATYELLPKLELTAGARYTSDRKILGGFIDQVDSSGNVAGTVRGPSDTKTFNKLTYRAIATYHFSSGAMGYLSYSRGFKSGGYDTAFATGVPYDPEVLDAYEVGMKATLFDRHLRVNAALFHYDYTGLQLPVLVPPASQITVNASNAVVNGADVDATLRVNRFVNLKASFGYLDTKYKDFDDAPCTGFSPSTGVTSFPCSANGNRLLFSPKWSYNIGGDVKIPSNIGDISLATNYAYRTRYYFDVANRVFQNGYGLLNGSIGWSSRDGVFSINVFGENLTNKKFVLGKFTTGGFPDRYNAGAPRTYGLEMRARF